MSFANSNPGRPGGLIRLLICGCAAVALASGCARFKVSTPENFVEVESYSSSEFRALTPQEDKLFVRHFEVSEEGSLEFWTDAVRSQFVDERGYTLIEEGEFKTGAGLVGHRFLFEISMSEVPYRHEIVLFVTQGKRWFFWPVQHIYTAIFLCEKKNYDERAEAVHKALEDFKPLRGLPLESPSE